MTSKFEVGDHVWANCKANEMWPGRVCLPKDSERFMTNVSRYIYFYGQSFHAWIPLIKLKPYSEFMDVYINQSSADVDIKNACGLLAKYTKDQQEDLIGATKALTQSEKDVETIEKNKKIVERSNILLRKCNNKLMEVSEKQIEVLEKLQDGINSQATELLKIKRENVKLKQFINSKFDDGPSLIIDEIKLNLSPTDLNEVKKMLTEIKDVLKAHFESLSEITTECVPPMIFDDIDCENK